MVEVARPRLSPLLLCFPKAGTADEWLNVLHEAATGELLAAPGGGGGGGGGGGAAAPSAAVAASFISREGFLEVSSQNGEGWDRHWVSLCPHSRLLLFFNSQTKLPGTERAAFDMLSATLHETPPPGAPIVRGVVPAFWLSLENNGVYGPIKDGVQSPATAVVAADPDERAGWLRALTMAMDPSTMTGGGGGGGGAAAAAPQPSFSLMHVQRNANFLVSLGYPAERSVALNHDERTLCLWGDSKKKNLAAVLHLDAPNVKIDFGCEAAPRPEWSNLRMDVTAPAAGADDKYVTHSFSARTYKEFLEWASALAAL